MMASTVTVRLAIGADVTRIVEMARRFRAETAYAETFDDNPDVLRALAERLIASSDGLLLVAECGGHVVGMIGMVMYLHPFSGARTAGELCWWVDPEARGCGKALLETAETWAAAADAHVIQMVAPSPEVGALYKRRGYRPIETTWLKRLH